MQKYGFVYIWYDCKYKRYYIGSHWGTEEDGYICSSNWMRTSYNRRPNDFKRKIIVRVFSNRSDLLKKEHYYLSMTKSEELGKRYYNHTSYIAIPNGNGFHSEETKNKIRKNREKQNCPRTGKIHSEETKKFMSKNRKGRSPWNKGKKLSNKHKQALKESHKGSIPWNKGKTGYKMKKEQLGFYWVTNGSENKQAKKEDLDLWIEKGYCKGRTIKRKEASE